MNSHSSGYYSIDADYNIIGFNDTAKSIYPKLKLGEKCYHALMGLDSPCPPCPVANGIYGPKTYLDPIRHIYETVDAVETVLPDGSNGHALVFSTVAEGEKLASAIPTGEESLRLLGAINLLSHKYIAVFGVDINSQRISVFRCENLFGNENATLSDNTLYEEILDLFINKYIYPEERQSVRETLTLEAVKKRFEDNVSFKVHCRIMGEEVHYYYLQFTRDGEKEYEDFVVAIACEDDDVSARKIYENQLDSLVSSITHAAGYFHLDISSNKILKVGGTSEFVAHLDTGCSIDELMQGMSTYIPSERDRKDFLNAYSLASMKREYESGQVEIVRESRCYYDDNIARWSRYKLRLFVNPSNNHLEGVFYGADITHDKEAYETQVSIVQTLSSNYLDIFLLDTLEKTATMIKQDQFLSRCLVEEEKREYPYDDLIGKYISEQVHPDDQEMMKEVMRLDHVRNVLIDKKEYTGNYRIIDQGETHHYQFRFIKNEEYGIVVLGFLNVDDIVSAEIEQQQKLQDALEAAKRANSEKSLFLARMSHDMRTPLNGIVGILEIDNKHADDIDYLKQNRKKAVVVTNHLISLINDVLDMSKIEDGSLVLAHEAFDMMAEGREAQMIIDLQAQEFGIEIKTNITPPEEKYQYVYGSPLHLRRALMNIYNNCIKFNRENGSVVTEIDIPAYDERTVTYRWTIRDTGKGMSPEFLTRIFEPFVQEDTDARSVYRGTGLGMSIAKSLIEQMGGTLEVASEQGVGSTFVVTIPFELAKKEEVVFSATNEDNSIEGMHILLVEDNEMNRDIAETILKDEGAMITTAVNGKEAVDIICNHPSGTFDLVLMDIMMPVMDGYEATRQIRMMEQFDAASLPIVAMTANAFVEDKAKSLEIGMNDHITKPINVKEMLCTIAKYKKQMK